MTGLIVAMYVVFLGPMAVEYVITSRQIRDLEKEERKLKKMEMYGISEEDLTMSVKK